ncbi:MAG: B12-binding domain-containing protein [Acidobacteria bacterium]|nr:B12-binding domain-containing protein [Acidobacteriota bacterium]
MGMRQTNFLTTRQLARMWQVSEATIKRWADAGHLRSQKTLGGHRRFELAEVLKFQSARGLEAEHRAGATEAVTHTRQSERLEDFFRAVTSLHEAEASAVLLNAHLDGWPMLRILEEVIAPALHRVGDLWHVGEMSVADEHLSTRTATRAIETLRATLRVAQVEMPLAICCAVEDELHEIATLCVQTLLESEGWSVRNMGANTPFFALTDAVRKHRPRLICVSSTSNVSLARYSRDYAQLQDIAREFDAHIILGGEGFKDETIRQRFPADLHAENFSSLKEMLQQS